MKHRWPEGGLAGGTGMRWSLQVSVMSTCRGDFVVATSALKRAHSCGLDITPSRNPAGADKTFLLGQVSLCVSETVIHPHVRCLGVTLGMQKSNKNSW